MKKWIAILLIVVVVLSLTACGSTERYPELADLLDDKDYEGAVQYIYELYQKDQGTTETTGQGNEPTQEERDQLYAYRNAVSTLTHYAEEGGSISASYTDEQTGESVYVYGSKALEYYYKRIQQLTVVDKWAGTEYTTSQHISDGDEINWNRQEILNNFFILSNTKLEVSASSVDNMGNQNDNGRCSVWNYNPDGTLNYVQDGRGSDDRIIYYSNGSTCYYAYDEQGNLKEKRYGSADHLSALITCTTDEAGKVIAEHLKTNTEERDYTFTYGADGKLSQISWQYDEYSNRYIIDYTYDAAGNLVKEEKTAYYYNSGYEKEFVTSKWIMEYTYDAGGSLTSGVYTVQDWTYDMDYLGNSQYSFREYAYAQQVDQHEYTCDEQGRVVKEVITLGNRLRLTGDNAGEIINKPSYQTKTYETAYGDFYEYAPAK